MDAARWQDCLFCCTRSAEWSQEVEKAKGYQIRTKLSCLLLISCCVFNLVTNYPMIKITPHNWYCKNVQFSNRMTDYYCPKSTVNSKRSVVPIISLHSAWICFLVLQLGIDCALLAFGLHFHELLILLHSVQFSAFILLELACSGYTLWTSIETRVQLVCWRQTTYFFNQTLRLLFFSQFILLRLLIKGRVYFVGKPVDSNYG